MRGEQTARMLRLLQLLMARRTGVTVADLMETLNVSHRTIYRDLKVIEDAGFPLGKDQEAGRTVYQILDAERWKLGIPLEIEERVALHVGLDLLRAQGGAAWAEAAATAAKKLDAAAPGKIVARLAEALGGVSISTRGRRPYESRREILTTLHQAVSEQRPVEVVYATPGKGKAAPRRLHPLAVRLEHGGAYLVAWDAGHREVRTFLADRVQMASLGEGRFQPSKDFDVERYFADAFQVYRGGKLVNLRARFVPRVAHLVEERRWHPTQRVRHLDDGLELSMKVQDTPELRAWLMGFGGDVVVLAPKSLARALEDGAARVARQYAERRGREKRERGRQAARRRRRPRQGDSE